ncbi:flavin monoamine oxidase family protein [Streptomyces sp. NPDC058953]|uniref:flavin monoamine oxidase family protein n=1 Tax=unclassified Streptomyces TaxID=2593676 RepID=UPI0036B34308
MTSAYDTIVVGAGLAGVTAARELRAQGRRTLLLEAGDRVGGRIRTEEFAGRPVELGGAWIHWTQPHVWAELTRYGLTVTGDEEPDEVLIPTEEEPIALPADDVLTRVTDLLNRVFRGTDRYFPRPYDPLFRAEALAEFDQYSLRDWLDRLELTPDERTMVTGALSTELGGSSTRGAVSMLAQWWALGDLATHGYYSLVSLRPEAGMGALVEAVLADAGTELRLGTPVAAIDDDGRRVAVTTRAGERFTAEHAVVAVPVNVWPDIVFTPGLPAAHTATAAAGVGVPDSVKLWLHVATDRGPFLAQGSEGAPINTLMPHALVDDGQIMVGFSVDPSLDITDHGAVERAVQRLVPDAELLAYRAHDWGGDPFAKGGWGNRRPGALTTSHTELRRPHGRIVFAGADLADGWAGCIDGAVESGLKAARQVAGLDAPDGAPGGAPAG